MFNFIQDQLVLRVRQELPETLVSKVKPEERAQPVSQVRLEQQETLASKVKLVLRATLETPAHKETRVSLDLRVILALLDLKVSKATLV